MTRKNFRKILFNGGYFRQNFILEKYVLAKTMSIPKNHFMTCKKLQTIRLFCLINIFILFRVCLLVVMAKYVKIIIAINQTGNEINWFNYVHPTKTITSMHILLNVTNFDESYTKYQESKEEVAKKMITAAVNLFKHF